jgi:hypothetical protein
MFSKEKHYEYLKGQEKQKCMSKKKRKGTLKGKLKFLMIKDE